MADLIAIFGSILLAELGDKTQIATLLFAGSNTRSPLMVFLAVAAALTVSTAIAVLLGHAAQVYLQSIPTKLIAGIGFVLVGGWMIFEHCGA